MRKQDSFARGKKGTIATGTLQDVTLLNDNGVVITRSTLIGDENLCTRQGRIVARPMHRRLRRDEGLENSKQLRQLKRLLHAPSWAKVPYQNPFAGDQDATCSCKSNACHAVLACYLGREPSGILHTRDKVVKCGCTAPLPSKGLHCSRSSFEVVNTSMLSRHLAN